MAKPKKQTTAEMEILEIKQTELRCFLLGTTPLIFHAMPEKVRKELLLPAPKKNKAAKEAILKHDPLAEYRDSFYFADDEADTLFAFPSLGIKRAMGDAALEIPGATKASILRLCYVPGNNLPVYGIPELYMTVVRLLGVGRTPDIRTRGIMRNWAIPFSVRYVRPNLTERSISNLIQAAGIIIGIGDNRQEKGRGNNGLFEVVSSDHPGVEALLKNAGRKRQVEAFNNPTAYDKQTEALLKWFYDETDSRGLKRIAV